MITGAEALVYGAELFGPSIQPPVKLFGVQAVGRRLGLFGIGNGQESIVRHLEGNTGFKQPLVQPVMAIEIDLQAERCLGGHPDVTESKGRIDEVEVVMEAFAGRGFQRGMAFFLVMPGAISGAGFHGREDVDQPGMIATPRYDGLDPVLLAKGLVATDELDLNAGLAGELLGMVAQLIPQGLWPSWVIEQSDLVVTEVTRHGAGIANIRKRAGDDDTIEAGKNASDLIAVALDERIHGGYPVFLRLRIRIADTTNFGSGYAGLGEKGVPI